MEADQITVEQTVDDLPPPGQNVEHVWPGERGVMKERNSHVGFQAAQVRGHEPKIVIVHPYQAIVFDLLSGGLREQPVHITEGLPVDVLVLEQPRKRVQDRPQRLFGGDVVETFDLLRREGQSRDEIAAIRILDVNDPIEIDAFLGIVNLPGDPGAGLGRQSVKEAL